jgi:hypothetical protein
MVNLYKYIHFIEVNDIIRLYINFDLKENISMNKNRINLLWNISLLAIGVTTLIISTSSIAGITLPDVLKRCLGVIELVSLFVLVYTSVKKKTQ